MECKQDRRQSRDEWRLADARLAGELFFFDNDTLAHTAESPPVILDILTSAIWRHSFPVSSNRDKFVLLVTLVIVEVEVVVCA